MIVRANIEGFCLGVEPKMEYINNQPTGKQQFRDGTPLWSVLVIPEGEQSGQRVTVPGKTIPSVSFGERIEFADAEVSVAWARASSVALSVPAPTAEDFE